MTSLLSTASCGQEAPRLYVRFARLPHATRKAAERELALRIQAGEPGADYELASTVVGIIDRMVRYYRRRCRTFTASDLWQEAWIAAIEAARSYDPVTHDVRFSTYAWRALCWRFRNIAYKRDHLVRRPRRVAKIVRVLFDFDLAEPEPEDDPWDDEREIVARHLRHFPARTQRIFRLRAEGKTLEEIGREIGLTKERIRQIEARTIREIQERIKNGVNYAE